MREQTTMCRYAVQSDLNPKYFVGAQAACEYAVRLSRKHGLVAVIDLEDKSRFATFSGGYRT